MAVLVMIIGITMIITDALWGAKNFCNLPEANIIS